jgi:glycerophosphoryl diester phosphodiesterase
MRAATDRIRPPRHRAASRRPRALVLACVAALALMAAAPASAFDRQGHRGARGLAPENTMAAFRLALELGVDTLETDMGVTADDVIVLAHDPRLNPAIVRQPDGRWVEPPGGALRAMLFADLRRLDVGRLRPDSEYARQWPQQRPVDGERMPALAELLALVREQPRRVALNLETKITPASGDEVIDPEGFARLLVRELRDSGLADRITVQSFDWRTLLAVRRLAPEIATACLTIESPSFDTVRPGPDGASPWHAGLRAADHGGSLPRLVAAAGCTTWSMFRRNLTEPLLREARALGLKVLPWTVNDPEEMRRLVRWGVDGIITDYPDRLNAVLAEAGIAVPARR